MRMRRILAIACFAALALASVDLRLLRMPFQERASLHERFTILPDRGGWAPEYPAFLEQVRAATPQGSSIALVVPQFVDADGYTYAYYRASYFLAGRRVLPTRGVDAVGPRSTDFVAVWPTRSVPVPRTGSVVFERNRGILLRQ